MISIAEVADKIGMHICEQGEMKEKFKVVAYGVEIILVVLISLVIINICGALAGMFPETLFVSIFALIMRYIIGGSHLSGFSRCLGFSTFMVLLFAALAKLHFGPVHQLVNSGMLVLAIGIILRHAPLMSFEHKNPLAEKRLRKVLAICLLTGIFALAIFSGNPHYHWTYFGLLLAILNVSPAGILLVNQFEKITKGGDKVR